MQTWLALPDGKEEIDPAFEHVDGDALPLVEDDGVSARVLMGTLWGKTAGVTEHSQTIYADILLGAGASIPIDADADERAVLVVEGDASLDGERLEPFTLYILAPGEAMTPQGASAVAGHAARRRGIRHPAPRVLELRLLVARPDQPGQGGLAGAALPARARRRRGVHPAARSAADGQLPVTESAGSTRCRPASRMNVALAGPEDAPPVILLHGFPESHRTWREVAPLLGDRFRLIMPDLRGFGDSDRPQDVADYATDTLVADIFALADALGIDRFALVGHDWGGAIAWAAALRGDPRIERLAIVNSPHPLIFQKSLIEDAGPARRLAIYHAPSAIPGMEAGIEAMGFETFFDKSFAKHVDLALIPPEERAATSPNGAGRARSPPCSTGTGRAR